MDHMEYYVYDLYRTTSKGITWQQYQKAIDLTSKEKNISRNVVIDNLFRELILKLTPQQIRELNKVYLSSFDTVFIKIERDLALKPFLTDILPKKAPNIVSESFRYVSKHQKEGEGFTVNQILTGPFSYLTHSLYLERDLKKIVASSHLAPEIHRMPKSKINSFIALIKESDKSLKDIHPNYRYEQYPGVYANLEIQEKGLQHISTYTFVMSLSLLAKKAWHVRGYSPYGGYGSLIDEEVWSPYAFSKYLSSEWKGKNFPEIIFHHPISLKYIGAVVCRNQTAKESAVKVIKGTKLSHLKVYTASEFDAVPRVKRIKYLYGPKPDINREANYCYSSIGEFTYGRPGKLNKYELYNTLLNCGYTEANAKKYISTHSYNQIIKDVTIKGLEAIRDSKYPPPKVHPPYITNKQTLDIFSWNLAYDQTDTKSLIKRTETVAAYGRSDVLAFQELSPWAQQRLIVTERLGYEVTDTMDKVLRRKFIFTEDHTKFQTKSGSETAYTFIKTKYQPKLVTESEFSSGRPILANILTVRGTKILFINVHGGHQTSSPHQTYPKEYLDVLNEISKKTSFKRLIIAGDFNMNIEYIKLMDSDGKTHTAKNIVSPEFRSKNYTCCNTYRDGDLKYDDEYGFVDNILDSYYTPGKKGYRFRRITKDSDITKPKVNIGSDHTAIVGGLPL